MTATSVRLFALSLLLLTSGGCATTRLVRVWSDQAYRGPAFRKVMVIGLTRSPTMRRFFESEFVRQLERWKVVDGEASYLHIPREDELKRKRIAALLAKTKFDAVLVTRLIRVDKKTRYVPPVAYTVPSVYYGFYPYYFHSYRLVHSPGYLTEDEIVMLETNLYDTKRGKLVWAGVTKSFNPRDSREIIDDLAELVVRNLRGRGLL